MALDPTLVARTRMHRRNEIRQIFAERLHRCGERPLAPLAQEICLRVLADEQGQAHVLQQRDELRMPGLAAFGSWRIVTAAPATGVAKSHWHDGNARFVVKNVAIDAHPRAQAFAAGVVPRNAGGVDLRARRLADDENARRRACAQHGIGTQRQVRFADPTGTYVAQQRVEPAGHGGSSLTWMLPLPAWPKLTMGIENFAAISRSRAISSGRRDTGTTTSSLILSGEMLRRAGDKA